MAVSLRIRIGLGIILLFAAAVQLLFLIKSSQRGNDSSSVPPMTQISVESSRSVEEEEREETSRVLSPSSKINNPLHDKDNTEQEDPAMLCDDWDCSKTGGKGTRNTQQNSNHQWDIIALWTEEDEKPEDETTTTTTITKRTSSSGIIQGAGITQSQQTKQQTDNTDTDATKITNKVTSESSSSSIVGTKKGRNRKGTTAKGTAGTAGGAGTSTTKGSSSSPSKGSTIVKITDQSSKPNLSHKHISQDFFTLNRAHGKEEITNIDSSSMTNYISTGGRFPILIVTCDRVEMLTRTLEALVKVRGVTKEDLYVVQDGTLASIKTVIENAGIRYHQKTSNSLRGGGVPTDGAERIATHYGYSLAHMFTEAFPTAPGIIVVEDDFLFSPDFYEYFHAVAPAIEADPTLWLASAWNDNGFDYLVADPHSLRRTRYFPGLGWLLPRRLFMQELRYNWPRSHWDHWMRDPAQHKGRDIIFPEIPRDYHAGVRGTFMDGNTHNRYFGSIAMQADNEFTWDTPTGAAAIEDIVLNRYNDRLRRIILATDTQHLNSIETISKFTEGVGIVWYDCPPNEPNHDKMRAIAGYFGIWHEGGRGSRDGVHELWWLGTSKLVLINAHNQATSGLHVPGSTQPSSLRGLMPKGHTPLDWTSFLSASRPQIPCHNTLFGAITSSPLAHIEGGPDANGPSDIDPNANTKGSAGGIVVYTRDSGWEHEEDKTEEHQHSHFMGDLKLQLLPNPNVVNGGMNNNDNDKNNNGPNLVGVLPETVHIVPSREIGTSCTQVCDAYSGDKNNKNPQKGSDDLLNRWTCASAYLPVINDCSSLRAVFDCASCGDSLGADQPAMVDRTAPFDKGPGSCLVNGDPTLFSCDGSWSFALRLCPCEAPLER